MILGLILTAILGVPIGTTLTFTWEPPTTNVDGSELTDLRQYRMYEQVNSGPWGLRMGIAARAKKATYRPMIPGVYKFKLTAVNVAREESEPSNEVEVVVEVPRPQPTSSASPTPSVIP